MIPNKVDVMRTQSYWHLCSTLLQQDKALAICH